MHCPGVLNPDSLQPGMMPGLGSPRDCRGALPQATGTETIVSGGPQEEKMERGRAVGREGPGEEKGGLCHVLDTAAKFITEH